jgi:hypothetical protein
MDAAAIIDKFLQLNEDRKLEEAHAMFAPNCVIEFPGGKKYNWVKKHRDKYFVGVDGDQTTVTSIGTLYGENLNGVAFEGVRYVDVFIIKDGLITEQHVWNDFGESGVLN